MGNIGKFIAILALNLENSLVTGDRRVVFFIRFDRDRRIFAGELADNIGKKLGIKCDFSTFQDRSFDLRLNSQLHIVAGQFDLIRNSIDQDAFENRHGGFRRNGLHNNTDAVNNIIFLKSELHNC